MRASSSWIPIAVLVAARTAAAAPATLPTLGWSIDVDDPAHVTVTSDTSARGAAEDVIALTARGETLRVAVVRSDQRCAEDVAGEPLPSWAPPGWSPARPDDRERSYDDRMFALCRDLEVGSLEVWLDAAIVVDSDDGLAVRPVLAALERAIEANDRPPIFDGPRAAGVFAEETADEVGTVAGTSHVYLAIHLLLPPRHLSSLDGHGYAVSAGVASGRTGGAFLYDLYVGNGYGLRVGPLAVRALAVGGVDRIGGGFEPVTSAYAGVQGYLRVALGDTYALEADTMKTWGTGGGETRVEIRALSTSRESLITIGAFYRHWRSAGILLGASFGLSFDFGG